jgi:anaerobic selenocysteine-containing dehydrogenase
MDLIVEKTREICEKYTANSIGFYTTGQLFLEEYYTLAVIGKAGLGTPHMDGNTRLCTATAEAALRESFGTDGQPGSYSDFDVTDCILHFGHNIASQQTVLWSRILDRLEGANPPKLIVVDPRRTETARRSDIHLPLRAGSNVALLNGLLHLLIRNGHVDENWIKEHTVGFDDLKRKTQRWTPAETEKVTGVPAKQIEAAAELLGTTPTLVSTVLQGVYQSMQATAAAIQVNNLHLMRGLIGKPGCAVFQMNGQPTAQNTRETGCDGSLPAMRNWENPEHVADIARLWNVEVEQIPAWSEQTHAMQIFRYAEEGSIRMLWIVCTNPAVSLPELSRIRGILGRAGLFLVIQDAFLTETAQFADVVLPAAMWGEKTGALTNADRTVHLSKKAVDPPGQARSDFDIFLDYARRMDLRDKDGAPLIKWKTPEEAFEAWKQCSKGRPCDYSGMSYEKLSGPSGIQWPCNEQFPNGAERLYTDSLFNTSADYCEVYGHDLLTGAVRTEPEYRAHDPKGRAIIKAADYEPPHEIPDNDYPFWLTTGRVVFHWHTRTKTARSEELNEAAPEAFVQISEADATKLGLREGDLVAIESRRGKVQAPCRIGDIEPGHVFIPFHYGYFDAASGKNRAANELTITDWDPVSKQPFFKYAAVKLTKVTAGPVLMQAKSMARDIAELGGHFVKNVVSIGKEVVVPPEPGLHVPHYLALLLNSKKQLAKEFASLAARHVNEPAIRDGCTMFAKWSAAHINDLDKLTDRYGSASVADAKATDVLTGARPGGLGLLRDLHDLWLMVNNAHLSIMILVQAARALRDNEMAATLIEIGLETDRQVAWLDTHIKTIAPQALVVPAI